MKHVEYEQQMHDQSATATEVLMRRAPGASGRSGLDPRPQADSHRAPAPLTSPPEGSPPLLPADPGSAVRRALHPSRLAREEMEKFVLEIAGAAICSYQAHLDAGDTCPHAAVRTMQAMRARFAEGTETGLTQRRRDAETQMPAQNFAVNAPVHHGTTKKEANDEGVS